MAGDLEDFLRRAAQRRQAKAAAQQQQQPAAPRQPPQYSNRRTERVARSVEPEEVVLADVIDEESVASLSRRVAEAKSTAAAIAKETARKKEIAHPSSTTDVSLTGSPAQDLIQLLKLPGGIQQAILLREVLDRPEHRW